MKLVRAHSRFVNNRLDQHYSADPYELERVRHSVLSMQLAIALCVVFGFLSWFAFPWPFFQVAGLVIAVFGVVTSLMVVHLNLSGHSSAANHLTMAITTLVIFSGIYLAGGFPYAITVHLAVLLPIVALRFYGARVGIIAAIIFPVLGVCEWFLEHKLGLIPTIFDATTQDEPGSFIFWFIGHFMLFSYFLVQHRESNTLQALLDAERGKFAALAVTDNLTGLNNSRKFLAEMDARIERSAKTSEQFQLVYLDLNHFKQVNDTHGHEAGDQVLQIAARRLKQCVRDVDMAARLGGDEFALLLSDGLSEQETHDVIARIESKIAEPISHKMHMLHVSASVGLARFPQDGVTRRELMNTADAHMYVDKSRKKAAEVDTPHILSVGITGAA